MQGVLSQERFFSQSCQVIVPFFLAESHGKEKKVSDVCGQFKKKQQMSFSPLAAFLRRIL